MDLKCRLKSLAKPEEPLIRKLHMRLATDCPSRIRFAFAAFRCIEANESAPSKSINSLSETPLPSLPILRRPRFHLV